MTWPRYYASAMTWQLCLIYFELIGRGRKAGVRLGSSFAKRSLRCTPTNINNITDPRLLRRNWISQYSYLRPIQVTVNACEKVSGDELLWHWQCCICPFTTRRTIKHWTCLNHGSFRGGTLGNAVHIVKKPWECTGTEFPLLKFRRERYCKVSKKLLTKIEFISHSLHHTM